MHEKQTKRMITRSEWFLGTNSDSKDCELNTKNSNNIKSIDFCCNSAKFLFPMPLKLFKHVIILLLN